MDWIQAPWMSLSTKDYANKTPNTNKTSVTPIFNQEQREP